MRCHREEEAPTRIKHPSVARHYGEALLFSNARYKGKGQT
jgi:hypothetical protein